MGCSALDDNFNKQNGLRHGENVADSANLDLTNYTIVTPDQTSWLISSVTIAWSRYKTISQ